MPWYCDPVRPEMTKSLLPQSLSTPQQLAGKDGSLAKSHTWPPYTLCRRLRHHARLSGWTAHIRVCHSADDSWVPSKGFALFPRHQSESVRTFSIWAWQAIGFFGDRYACRDQRTCNQIIQSMVSVWLFSPELSCKHYGPQWNWPMTHTGTDVAHKGSDPAPNQHPLSPPHRQAAGHTKWLAWQKANLHCEARKLPKKMLCEEVQSGRIQQWLCRRERPVDPRMAVWVAEYLVLHHRLSTKLMTFIYRKFVGRKTMVKWCHKCAESVTRCRTDKFAVLFLNTACEMSGACSSAGRAVPDMRSLDSNALTKKVEAR